MRNNYNNYDAWSDDMRYADLCARAMVYCDHRRRIRVDIASNYKWNILRFTLNVDYTQL